MLPYEDSTFPTPKKDHPLSQFMDVVKRAVDDGYGGSVEIPKDILPHIETIIIPFLKSKGWNPTHLVHEAEMRGGLEWHTLNIARPQE